MPHDSAAPSAQGDALSALPSPLARIVAFASILAGGLAGGVIGHALVDVQCAGDCTLGRGLGVLIGALSSAGGMSVVAVLGLRAIGEWRQLGDRPTGTTPRSPSHDS
ncbi:MAG: hypothetical protein ACO3IV_06840 [Ilumatobacteraceae bacterium]|jgi:hypothetical protein